jgi:uncharacterized protein YxjI
MNKFTGGMRMLLDGRTFFVKEQVDFLRLAGVYDIFDPNTNQQIAVAKEEPGGWIKFFRLLVNKTLLPNKINVYDSSDNSKVIMIQKPFSFFRSKVSVYNRNGEYLGYFKSKILTLGGGFWVFDAMERQVAEIKGDWKGWNFKFLGENGQEIGNVTKKWAGIGRELFTSADNYMIALNETAPSTPDQVSLLLAAGLAIDIVFKERKS